MKFKNLKTGHVLRVTDEQSIALMRGSERYQEIPDTPVTAPAKTEPAKRKPGKK